MNLALQPCAMALDATDDHECPHCPPAHTTQHGEHAPSARLATMDEMPCATSADDCSLVDDLKYDGRNTELKLKDAPGDVPLAIVPANPQILATRSSAEIGWFPARSPPPGNHTPLNVLYCVYLD